jgi:hypothetical protein
MDLPHVVPQDRHRVANAPVSQTQAERAQRELTTQRLDLRPAGPYGSMQRTQLGLATLVDKALRRQLIGGGEVEQLWRRRSHRQSYRQLAEKTAGASEKAAGGGVRRFRRA